MTRILSGPQLLERFLELLKKCEGLDVAVAWATDWHGLGNLIEAGNRCKKGTVRVILGINDYITSPNALRKLDKSTNLKIFGKPDGRLFHSKLYIFKFAEQAVCWIGSANLTKSAFNDNIETVLEFTDIDSKANAHFLSFWESEQARGLGCFDLAEYELRRLERKSKFEGTWTILPEDDETESSSTAPIDENIHKSDVLDADWKDHLYRMRNTGRNLEEWASTLDSGYEFVSRDWGLDFTDREVAIMFGQDHKGESFMAFGNLARVLNVYSKNFRGLTYTAKKNRAAIGKELIDIRSLKMFSVDMVIKSFENLKNLDGCGYALATRLLVFARPDWFVVANLKTFDGLKKEFSLPVNVNLQPTQYAKLIERIQQKPWSTSKPPIDLAELRLWRYRAALLDPILYQGKVGDQSVVEILHP